MSRFAVLALLAALALPAPALAQPDLQGIWTNGTLTPFERPLALGTKAFYTPEEAAIEERQATERRNSRTRRPGDVGNDNEAFVDSGYRLVSTRQTSLIVDPPDGRIPIRPEAEKRRDLNVNSLDSFETMSPWDRCITRSPTNLFPAGYNNAYQIVQTPSYVMIMSEMIHEARIIPTDGRPHSKIRQWHGSSRGRWEGDTLVVETINFTDKTNFRGAGENLKLVERFSRTDADTLTYRVTIEDPTTFTKPWTVQMPMMKSAEDVYEYACHEGNHGLEGILKGSRLQDKLNATGTTQGRQ